MNSKWFLYFLLLILFVNLTPFARAETLIVTNTEDSGSGSLRQAILDANSNEQPDTIVFQIPVTDAGYDAAAGVWRIEPASRLPYISSTGTVIDGTTQADFIGGNPNPDGPEIVIDGLMAGEAEGLYIWGNNHVIKGLVIHRFRYDLVRLNGDSNQVAGCFIGPDAAGKNRLESTSTGLSINGSCNIVGGLTIEERNVISGNKYNGVEHQDGQYNKITGNYIGLTSSGTDTLGNGTGMRISQAKHITIGPKNVISGNDREGITFQQNSDSSTVIGNFIGTDYTGTVALGNKGDGIFISTDCAYHVIGNGSVLEYRNTISGNLQNGITISGEASDFNQVKGNYIGTSYLGEFALPNGVAGIVIHGKAKFNTIGGENPEDGNIISGNIREGIQISGEGTSGNIIQNNSIGTAADGTTPLPNSRDGILITNSASGNRIGPGNPVAFNMKNGINIDYNAINNTITQNSIYNNEEKGIQLYRGGNNELAPPEVTQHSPVTGTTLPNATVEIFSTADDEGQTYHATVIADTSGLFTWNGTPTGPFITATATDDSGNTSGFSSSFAVKVEEDKPEQPSQFSLSQNYPNPFNPETTIEYRITEKNKVILQVFNLCGEKICTIVDSEHRPGIYQAKFNAANLPSGLYFYKMQCGNFQTVKKCVLMK